MIARRPVALLTRPQADSEALAQKLAEAGWDSVIAPVMQIRHLALPETGLKAFDGWVVTSRHAVPALQDLRQETDARPVFAVGAATAKELQDAGIKSFFPQGGDSEGLAALIKDFFPENPVLCHLSGNHVSENFLNAMQSRDIEVASYPVYEAAACGKLGTRAGQALQAGEISAVLFFSARSAALFDSLCRSQELKHYLRQTRALCLAPSVVKSLNHEDWMEILIAERPDFEGIQVLLRSLRT